MANSMSSMTPRERVLAAARGLPHDRTPVMYLLNPHAACKMMADFQPARSRVNQAIGSFLWKRFAAAGGMDGPDLWRALPQIIAPYANRDYAVELGADLLIQPVGPFVQKTYWEHGKLRVLDVLGSVRGIGGIYGDVIRPAIRSYDDLPTYTFPYAKDEKAYDALKKYRREHPEQCLAIETFGVQDVFATQIWEMSQFMMALYDCPDEVKDFQRRLADWDIDRAVRGIRAGADIALIYEDLGFTDRIQLSLPMWKEFTLPHLKRIIAAIHEEGGIAMLHSCGHQMPLLPYYIDAELDILQSFQPKANNDFAAAYATFGDRLTFCTGIDTQQGELMTAEDMRESIIRAWRIGRTKARHILGMTHMLQMTMPDDNRRAIFDTVHAIQRGEVN